MIFIWAEALNKQILILVKKKNSVSVLLLPTNTCQETYTNASQGKVLSAGITDINKAIKQQKELNKANYTNKNLLY